MSLERALKQASVEDPESHELLSRELERRGFGASESKADPLKKRFLNCEKTDHTLLNQWLTWFNTEMDPLHFRARFSEMPGGDGNYYTKMAFLYLLGESHTPVHGYLGELRYTTWDLVTNRDSPDSFALFDTSIY